MAVNTRGTELWFYDDENSAVVKIGCPTNISLPHGTRDQIEVPPCLDANSKVYMSGLITPGEASLSINFDPEDTSHVRMHELFLKGDNLKFALGFSGSTTAPTWGSTDWTIPTARNFVTFDGYFSSYSMEFAAGATVTGEVPIQISGTPTLHKAT